MVSGKLYAVLTGDIVSSSQVIRKQGGLIQEWILSGEKQVKKYFPDSVYAAIDIFRGDSWQMVLEDPVRSLRIALLFRAAIRSSAGIDSRVAIGYGPVDYLPEENVSTGTGEAFRLSGKGLRDLVKPVRMNLSFQVDNRTIETRALDKIVSLIDLEVQRWTRKQAEAVAGALVGLTQQQIADLRIGDRVSQQAISQHLESAGWAQLKPSLEFVESVLPGLLGITGGQ